MTGLQIKRINKKLKFEIEVNYKKNRQIITN